MSHTKCPYCHYRIFAPLATGVCPNCDRTLPGQFSSSLPSTSPAPSNLALQSLTEDENIPPYDASSPEAEPLIVPPSIERTIAAQRPGGKGLLGKIFHLASVDGVVIGVQTQQEFQHTSDIVGGFFKAIRDILWPMMDTPDQRHEDRIVVTQIRLRTANGFQRDARLEGRLIGASISLGDEVTLQGRYHKGTLRVRRAYNHTTEARILTRGASSSFLVTLIGIAVLIAALYLLASNLSHGLPWR